MQLKHTVLALATALLCATANAQIPVTDASAITNSRTAQIETIAKWVLQFKQLKEQLELGQAQFEAMTGSRGMAELANNLDIQIELPEDWEEALQTFKNSSKFDPIRAKFPTNPNAPKTNELFDTMALQEVAMNDFYDKSKMRMQQIEVLRLKIDEANDPAAKADLQNRLITEQNSIQASTQMIELIKQKNVADLDKAEKAASKEFLCKEFNTPEGECQ